MFDELYTLLFSNHEQPQPAAQPHALSRCRPCSPMYSFRLSDLARGHKGSPKLPQRSMISEWPHDMMTRLKSLRIPDRRRESLMEKLLLFNIAKCISLSPLSTLPWVRPANERPSFKTTGRKAWMTGHDTAGLRKLLVC